MESFSGPPEWTCNTFHSYTGMYNFAMFSLFCLYFVKHLSNASHQFPRYSSASFTDTFRKGAYNITLLFFLSFFSCCTAAWKLLHENIRTSRGSIYSHRMWRRLLPCPFPFSLTVYENLKFHSFFRYLLHFSVFNPLQVRHLCCCCRCLANTMSSCCGSLAKGLSVHIAIAMTRECSDA